MSPADVPERYRARWHEALQRAGFTPFRADGPGVSATWAGGFGSRGGQQTTYLGVHSRINGVEVEVDTSVDRHRGADDVLGALVHRQLHEAVVAVAPVQLPVRIELDADDRAIVIDGESHTFRGVVSNVTSLWLGYHQFDHRLIEVATPARVDGLELVACPDPAALTEFPPPP